MEHKLDEILKPHTNLDPTLFLTEDQIKPEIQKKSLNIGQYFWESINLPGVKLEDILLVGSAMGYRYTQDSDIDIILAINIDNFGDQSLIQSYLKSQWIVWHTYNIKLSIITFR